MWYKWANQKAGFFTFHSDDVTQNPERLVPSLMGFVRVRVRARAGSQARGDRDVFCARG